MNTVIPWAKPDFWGKEKEYVLDALKSSWISGGPYVEKLERYIANYGSSRYALSSSNGTTALHMAFLALGLKKGDEIIVPGFGFLAAANMAWQMQAKPVFAEVDPQTWCMRASDIEPCLTSRTKIIVPIHTYGNACNMEEIMALAESKRIAVVEDAAESFACRYKGKLLGYYGTIGSFSFQATKTITTGEGGMVVTQEKDLYEAMALYRSHGLLRKRHYWHELPGYNFRLTNIQAALGCAQFEKLDEIVSKRKRVHLQYKKLLENFQGVTMQVFPPEVDAVPWAIAVKLDPDSYPQGRDAVLEQMFEAGIEARPGFYTAYTMKHLYASRRIAVCEELSAQIISLPSFPTLTEQQIGYICKQLKTFRHGCANK